MSEEQPTVNATIAPGIKCLFPSVDACLNFLASWQSPMFLIYYEKLTGQKGTDETHRQYQPSEEVLEGILKLQCSDGKPLAYHVKKSADNPPHDPYKKYKKRFGRKP